MVLIVYTPLTLIHPPGLKKQKSTSPDQEHHPSHCGGAPQEIGRNPQIAPRRSDNLLPSDRVVHGVPQGYRQEDTGVTSSAWALRKVRSLSEGKDEFTRYF